MRKYIPQGALEMLHSYYVTDCTTLLRRPVPGCTTHLVRGLESDLWLEGEGVEEVGVSSVLCCCCNECCCYCCWGGGGGGAATLALCGCLSQQMPCELPADRGTGA